MQPGSQGCALGKVCVRASVRDDRQEGRRRTESRVVGKDSGQRLPLLSAGRVFVLFFTTEVSKFHLLLSAHPLPLALGLKPFQVARRSSSVAAAIRTGLPCSQPAAAETETITNSTPFWAFADVLVSREGGNGQSRDSGAG